MVLRWPASNQANDQVARAYEKPNEWLTASLGVAVEIEADADPEQEGSCLCIPLLNTVLRPQ
jgi:hypothetical protein